jgi:hypothetical protein
MIQREKKAWSTFADYIDTSILKKERIESNREAFSDVILQNRRGAVILIENKALKEWPKRSSTYPLKDSFEPGQLPFLRSWRQWQGNAYVFLHVGEGSYIERLLLCPLDPLEFMTKDQLLEQALCLGRDAILTFLETHTK